MSASDWLRDITIDWSDFAESSRISSGIVRELARDRDLLRRMVLDGEKDPHLRPLAEKHGELNYVVLYDALDRGMRIRLHKFTKGLEDIPHNHRFSFSSALLAGSYVHTLFHLDRGEDGAQGREPWALGQPEGIRSDVELRNLTLYGYSPALETKQAAGSSYSLHHTTVHKTWMPDEDAYSIFCRGPAAKPCALQLEPDVRTYRWKFGQANETEESVAERKMSDDEFKAYLVDLEKDGII